MQIEPTEADVLKYITDNPGSNIIDINNNFPGYGNVAMEYATGMVNGGLLARACDGVYYSFYPTTLKE